MRWGGKGGYTCPFLHFEGAFDSTSHNIMPNGMGLKTMCRVSSMLGNRKLTVTLARETLEGSVTRGCLQGGILSPLLCSLVGWTHRGAQWEWLLYTGVCRIYHYHNQQKISKHCLGASSGGFQYSKQRCDMNQLSINPQTMVTVSFTEKRDLRGLKKSGLSGHKTADYWSKIPRTHFKQETDMESTAGKYDV